MYFLPSVDDHWSCGSSTVLIDQMTYHILSKCGSSLMCVFREPATPNDLLHWTQLYALSLLWVTKTMCLLRSPAWLNDWTLLHLASTIGERVSLNFDFVLLRSGTLNTKAFDKLEALYFKDFLIFWKTFYSKTFQTFTCLMFLLNLLQLFWTPKFMAA